MKMENRSLSIKYTLMLSPKVLLRFYCFVSDSDNVL